MSVNSPVSRAQGVKKENMGVKELERAILSELRVVAKNNKLKLQDLMEWATAEIKVQEGETLYFLPVLKVYCAVKN